MKNITVHFVWKWTQMETEQSLMYITVLPGWCSMVASTINFGTVQLCSH